MANDNDYTTEEQLYTELENQRELESYPAEELPDNPPKKYGSGFLILVLFAAFVDIIEIITTYTGVGAIISIPLGLIVDTAIFIGVGFSRNSRKQWKKFAAGFVAENFPVLASILEFIPFRTLSLLWMYRASNQEFKAYEASRETQNNEQ